MQLKELNGQLIAHRTPIIDIIKGGYVEQLKEFFLSEQVSNDLRSYSKSRYLDPDYWYLAINKDLSISDEQLYWEITVRDLEIQQTPLKGIVKFENDLPVLAFTWE